MNTLFCTPEQGKRLKELLPELTSGFVWARTDESKAFDKYPVIYEQFSTELLGTLPVDVPIDLLLDFAQKKNLITPSLTLQELRDVAIDSNLHRRFRLLGAERLESWYDVSAYMTAPELAEWVIARLEEAK
jgi:predicted transcriptional regulator